MRQLEISAATPYTVSAALSMIFLLSWTAKECMVETIITHKFAAPQQPCL